MDNHPVPQRAADLLELLSRFPGTLAYMAGYGVRAIVTGFRSDVRAIMSSGSSKVCGGAQAVLAGAGRSGRPAFRFDQFARSRLRAGTAPLMAEAEAALGPVPTAPAGSWPAPVRTLHGPLRSGRTWLLNRFGSPVHCEVCGEELFRGLAFVWQGRLQMLGAESVRVRADWDKMNRMAFRHVERDRCRPAVSAVRGRRHRSYQQPCER